MAQRDDTRIRLYANYLYPLPVLASVAGACLGWFHSDLWPVLVGGSSAAIVGINLLGRWEANRLRKRILLKYQQRADTVN